VPVLAGSAAYAIGEACERRVSLESTPPQAVRFYATITAATVTGLSLNFLHIDPMRALFWAAVLNGLAAAPLMALIVTMAANHKVMGNFAIPKPMQILGWVATFVMFAVGVVVFVTWR